MMNNNLFPISKEGWSYIGYSVVLFLLLGFLDLDFLQFFTFLLIIFFIYVYRNPERQMPAFEKGGITSPVDGKIVDVTNDDNAINITLESSYNDVSVLRVPIESVVSEIKEQKGASLSKNSLKAKILNEKLSISFKDSKERVVKVSHTSNLSFSHISHDLINSQKLIQGSRYGVMPKGISIISLPKGSKINVQIGNEIRACESVIAYLS
ncbi:MAG: phosphatidylserine decarboxylase [Thiovulaceae bacterium]|nr:phosphatidylserine decarboxylase [Sulfurimonadaceae bacterium]